VRPGFGIRDSGFGIRDSQEHILVIPSAARDLFTAAKSRYLAAPGMTGSMLFRIPNPESRIPNPESRIPAP